MASGPPHEPLLSCPPGALPSPAQGWPICTQLTSGLIRRVRSRSAWLIAATKAAFPGSEQPVSCASTAGQKGTDPCAGPRVQALGCRVYFLVYFMNPKRYCSEAPCMGLLGWM